MKLSFHGAAQMVTGSCYLLEVDGINIMVDCGMFQGGGDAERLNQKPLPFDISTVDYLILTHAHIDHSGRLPWLIKQGFQGKFIATQPTIQLSELMFIDSAKIQEYDLKRKRVKTLSLYTVKDAINALSYFQALDYNKIRMLSDNVELELYNSGHILGASIVKLTVVESGSKKTIVFSGDLGHVQQKIVNPPAVLESADYIVVESTYGDRIHLPRKKSVKLLHEELSRGFLNQGNIIIPSFAVERTQEILYELNHFYENGEFTNFPVYFDTPLGISATKIYSGFADYYNSVAQDLVKKGDDPFDFPNLIITKRGNGNKNNFSRNGIIIAGSGMCTGGRVIGYLKKNISNPNSTIIFVGYQAEGTLGREISENAREVIIDGKIYKIKAKVISISGFSAHSDRTGLLNWISNFNKSKIKKVFITHGERTASKSFSDLLKTNLNINAHIPTMGAEFILT